MWKALHLTLVASIALGWTGLSHATPLQIRARTTLDVQVEALIDGQEITGVLQTDQGRGLPGEIVRVSVGSSKARSITTDQGGAFRVPVRRFPSAEDERTDEPDRSWEVLYDGGRLAGPSRAWGVVPGNREPSRIQLAFEPSRTHLDGPAIAARVMITAGGKGVGSVPAFLRVGDGAELVGATDGDGQVFFLLHPDLLQQQGRLSVTARWAGDHRFSLATGTQEIFVGQPTRLTLRLTRVGSLATGRYRFSGRLSDHRGAIPGASIALRVREDRSVAKVRDEQYGVTQTDARGNYVFAVEAQSMSDGSAGMVEAQVVYIAGDGLHEPAKSPVVSLPVPGPPGVSFFGYVAVVAAAMALALALFQAMRAPGFILSFAANMLRPSRRILGRREGVGLGHDESHTGRPDWLVVAILGEGDSELSPGSTRATLTRLDGDDAPLPSPGHFVWGPLEPGDYRLRCESSGYMDDERLVTIPHDGSLDPRTVTLVAIRGYVLEVFTRALARVGLRLRWGRETPAEVMARCPELGRDVSDALGALHQQTEGLWFTARAAQPADVERADGHLRRVERDS